MLSSECHLAGLHIQQGVREVEKGPNLESLHPIEIFAMAYGLKK